MPKTIKCVRWSCQERTTYAEPLCYPHWKEWQGWILEECTACHWFFSADESLLADDTEYEDMPFQCDHCMARSLSENGRLESGLKRWAVKLLAQDRPVAAHANIMRTVRAVYLLKLKDNSYYVGQTTSLQLRMKQHKDGEQHQTRGKEPKLVYFETFEGDRELVDDREKELSQLTLSGLGRRRIIEMIEEFRGPLKLIDLTA